MNQTKLHPQCQRQDSNLRPLVYDTNALTAELRWLVFKIFVAASGLAPESSGYEPDEILLLYAAIKILLTRELLYSIQFLKKNQPHTKFCEHFLTLYGKISTGQALNVS